MSIGFPRSVADLRTWAAANGVTLEETRIRFAQYVVLVAITRVHPMRESLVFKGGNALDFLWQPNRSTLDLDFSLDMQGAAIQADVEPIRVALERGLAQTGPLFGATFQLYSVKQQPPGEGRTFITFAARAGYALSDEPRLLMRMARGRSSSHVVPIEISVNEPICEATDVVLDDRFPPLRVSTIEDIVAEKLRALLQQTIRNRTRPQDLLDIALIVREQPALDVDRIARYMRVKAHARNVPVSRRAFRNPELAERAAVGYDGLRQTTRTTFIPFDEALAVLLEFVDRLSIPEE